MVARGGGIDLCEGNIEGEGNVLRENLGKFWEENKRMGGGNPF